MALQSQRSSGPWIALVLWVTVATAAMGNALEIHRRICEMELEVEELRVAGDLQGAQRGVRRMAALDAEHPRIYAQAVKLYRVSGELERATELIRSLGSRGPGLTYGRGLIDFHRGEIDEALLAIRGALEQYRALDHAAGQGSCHFLLGLILDRKRLREEAAVELQLAQGIFEELEDHAAVASALSTLGKVSLSLQRPQESLRYHESALAIQQRLGERSAQARTWNVIGRTLRLSGRPAESVEALQTALELRRELGDEPAQFATLKELARSRLALDEHDAAVSCWLEAASLAEGYGNAGQLARVRLDLGEHHMDRGRLDEALVWLRRAVGAAAGSNDPKILVRAERTLGAALQRAGEYSAAADALQASVAHASGAGQAATRALARTDLALVHFTNGKLTEALLEQQRALETFRRLRRQRSELVALTRLGGIYHRLGDAGTAEMHLRQSLALARELEDGEAEARALGNLGVLLARRGDLDAALEHQRASIELWQAAQDVRGTAFSRFGAADTLLQLGRFESAQRLLDEALAGFRSAGFVEGEAYALNLAGRLARARGRPDGALESFAAALEISSEYGFQRQLWIAHAGSAAVHRERGRLDLAMNEYNRALQVIESLRAELETDELRVSYFADKSTLYESAVALQAQLEGGAAATAFRLAEQARSRSLLDLLTESRASLRQDVPAELVEREKRLVDAVSSTALRLTSAPGQAERSGARATLALAEEELRRFRLELRHSAPRYSRIADPTPAGLREVQARTLNPGETLLRYFMGDDEAMVWVVRADGASFHVLPRAEEIGAAVAGFLDLAGRAAVSVAGRSGGGVAALSKMLLDFEIPPGDRLLIVPDGPLHHLPFEALRRNGRYLIEDHEVVVVPSATALQLMRAQPAAVAGGGFLGVGDPVADDADPRFPPLPHSRQALRAIGEMFPAEGRVVLEGDATTKRRLRDQPLDRFRYVHFATHGMLDRENPRYYGLRLAPASDEGSDDFLYLDDVFAMRLASELVVLSACRSGSGELMRGEGLVGLTRAFLYAGSRSVLVSLWNVNDRSTAEFMRAFYADLREGRTVSEALRRTKLRFIGSDRPAQRQPYRWAPFVLVGDPGPARTGTLPGSSTAPGVSRSGSRSPRDPRRPGERPVRSDPPARA